MKKKQLLVANLICLFCCVFLLLACNDNKPSEPISEGAVSNGFAVYQQGAAPSTADEFTEAMNSIPLDKAMGEELLTTDLASVKAMQDFYGRYIGLWTEELSGAISCLKTYLSEEEARRLDAAQTSWEKSHSLNSDLDTEIIASHNVCLGTQYIAAERIYQIDLYRERVIHLRYMIYLIETCGETPIEAEAQKWNVFIY